MQFISDPACFGELAGHVYGEWIDERPADCTKTGTKGHYHCETCGGDFDASYAPIDDLTIPKADHVYGDWYTDVELETVARELGIGASPVS